VHWLKNRNLDCGSSHLFIASVYSSKSCMLPNLLLLPGCLIIMLPLSALQKSNVPSSFLLPVSFIKVLSLSPSVFTLAFFPLNSVWIIINKLLIQVLWRTTWWASCVVSRCCPRRDTASSIKGNCWRAQKTTPPIKPAAE